MSEKYSEKYIVALDQGTTSSRSILYNLKGEELKQSSAAYECTYPQNGWVEQNADDIWKTQSETLKNVLSDIDPKAVIAIGITNQRETIVAWDKNTGQPLAPAIVWQCRRTSDYCEQLKSEGQQDFIKQRTGLPIDPYFSASKMRWLIDNSDAVRAAYQDDSLLFGTVDSWLIFNLTGNLTGDLIGNHYTDSSNASRTQLMNLETCNWDADLLKLFDLKESVLPEIKPSAGDFGICNQFSLEAPIKAVLGDQQASLFGHQAWKAGESKCTFGTGAFLMHNTGSEIVSSDTGLLSTLAWQIGSKKTYALEGSVFIAGSLIGWLRDKLGIISESSEVEELAMQAGSSKGVVLIPAFVGLGAPHWKADVRGVLSGLTSDIGRNEIAYAALEGIAHQVADLLDLPELAAMESLKVDGGMIRNALFLEILANLTQKTIVKSARVETTAFGVYLLAAQEMGLEIADMAVGEKIEARLNSQEIQEARSDWQQQIAKLIA